MIFFSKMNEFIYKYNVTFDNEQITKMRDLIIDKCSTKTHIVRKGTVDPRMIINPQKETIVSFSEYKTGEKDSYNDISDDKDVYRYDYILVSYPKLVGLINGLLNGDENALYELIGNYQSEEPIDYDALIKAQKEKIIDILNNNPMKVDGETKDLMSLIEKKRLNEGQASTELFYKELISKLEFKALGKFKVSDFETYNKFFGVDETIESIKLRRQNKTSR